MDGQLDGWNIFFYLWVSTKNTLRVQIHGIWTWLNFQPVLQPYCFIWVNCHQTNGNWHPDMYGLPDPDFREYTPTDCRVFLYIYKPVKTIRNILSHRGFHLSDVFRTIKVLSKQKMFLMLQLNVQIRKAMVAGTTLSIQYEKTDYQHKCNLWTVRHH